MKAEIIELVLPDWLASALINDDYTSFHDDPEGLKIAMDLQGKYSFLECEEGPGFLYGHSISDIVGGSNCLVYRAVKI